MILKKVCQQRLLSVLSRNISYVERSRLLEKIKTNEDFCKTVMKDGQFLLYNKGKPLMKKSSGPVFVDYYTCLATCPGLENESVVLSVNSDGVPTFAAPLSQDSDPVELETKTLATFTDLRMGLFMVNTEVAHQLSKVNHRYLLLLYSVFMC